MDMKIGMDSVLLNLDSNQRQFQNTVTQLSSGLRVNTAADDPSGNAIATNLQSKTQGVQQAVQNVQNANNALNVAMGALTAVQTILERINNAHRRIEQRHQLELRPPRHPVGDQSALTRNQPHLTKHQLQRAKTSQRNLRHDRRTTNPTFTQVDVAIRRIDDRVKCNGASGGAAGPV